MCLCLKSSNVWLIDWLIVDMNLDTADLTYRLKTNIYESHTQNLFITI